MMKKLVVFLVAMMSLSVAGPAAALEVSGDAYAGVFSEYVWRGWALSGGLPVIQGGVDFSAKGFTLGYWSNFQTTTDPGEGFRSNEITETDVTLDYTHTFGEMVSVSVGHIFYALDGINDTNELYLGVALDTLLSPSFKVYYDYDEANETGLFYAASIGHSFDLMDKLSLSLGALVSYNDESDYSTGNYNDWHNYELSAGIDYAPLDYLTISPSLLFSEPISDDAKLNLDSQLVSGLTVTLAF
jgi:uncharacterized protein (TIGR02001 family)